MRFRRIYWVTEQVGSDGISEITGVFTSIPDLIEVGLGALDWCDKNAEFRIVLVELDSDQPPLLTITQSSIDQIESMLLPFVTSGEISHDEVLRLGGAIRSSMNPV